jgi:CRP/FNR family cyclic AMP-dependent transcriptional regulator
VLPGGIGRVPRKVTFPILDQLGEEERTLVLGEARRRRFDRGEVVLHAGDPADAFHLIASGRVVVRRTSLMGDTAILGFLGPGEFFGELALIGRAPPMARTATVEAIEPTESLSIRAEQFEALRRREPAVDRFLVELLTARVVELDERLVEALLIPAEVRVLRRLLGVTDRLAPGEGRLIVDITQEDLGNMAGASRATVNRVLRAAAVAGLLRVSRGKVEIVDREALGRRALIGT